MKTKFSLLLGFILIFSLTLSQTAQALTMQEILQGYDNPKGVVLSAEITNFYVDPDFIGTTQGTADNPWTTLGNGKSAQWAAVNAALASGDVNVYFSAREALSDIPDEITKQILIYRSDTSSHRLTLDGMSIYNTNDTVPQWVDYSGTSKMRIKITGQSLSIGTELGSGTGPMNYTTIHGFEVTGSTGRVVFGGSHVVIENMRIHDITNDGATLQLGSAVKMINGVCTEQYGRLTDITIRNNLIENGFGEGIYIADNYAPPAQGACPLYGNGHTNILIENNTIRNAGKNGGQGDGIDLKAGLLNVTVRANTIDNGNATGITVSPVFDGVKQNLLKIIVLPGLL